MRKQFLIVGQSFSRFAINHDLNGNAWYNTNPFVGAASGIISTFSNKQGYKKSIFDENKRRFPERIIT